MYIMNEMDVFTLHNIGFNVAALSFKKQRDGISLHLAYFKASSHIKNTCNASGNCLLLKSFGSTSMRKIIPIVLHFVSQDMLGSPVNPYS